MEDSVAAVAASAVASNMHGLAMKRRITVRLATKKDAHFIVKLVGELADYQKLRAAFVATAKGLQDTLFNLPPYQGPTTFILESTTLPAGPHSGVSDPASEDLLRTDGGVMAEMMDHGRGSEVLHTQEITLRREIMDVDRDNYKAGGSGNGVVVGFVLFFPNYSTLLGKAGYYVEDLYIREPYRGHGLGTILLNTVAQQAVKRGAERMEWCVLDWDENAIKFYKGLGATFMPEWRMCRLSGVALKRCDQFLQFNSQSSENNKPL